MRAVRLSLINILPVVFLFTVTTSCAGQIAGRQETTGTNAPAAAPTGIPDAAQAWRTAAEIQARIITPVFPAKDFFITDFGASGDGRTDCSTAFARAIQACISAGGGRVIVPQGIFLTGAIRLKSRVNLHVQEGATILFTRNLSGYLPVVLTRFEGVECMNYSPFIYAYGETDVAVTGSGILNGNADYSNWWNWKSTGDNDRRDLFSRAEKGVPVTERVFGDGHELRVNFIQPYSCTNVLIEGVTILQSPMWVVHPVLCKNVTVRNIRVDSHGPNNDGCNPESCRDVLIQDCTFSTGDDCIAIKSGRNNDGRRIAAPSENIIIRGVTCLDGHGAVTFGSECSGDIRNVFVEECRFDSPNLWYGIRLKTNSVRGGVIENLFFRNITIGQVSNAAIHITMMYEEGDAGRFTPVIRNIHIDRLACNRSQYMLYIQAYSRSPVTNILIVDSSFANTSIQQFVQNAAGLEFINTRINGVLK